MPLKIFFKLKKKSFGLALKLTNTIILLTVPLKNNNNKRHQIINISIHGQSTIQQAIYKMKKTLIICYKEKVKINYHRIKLWNKKLETKAMGIMLIVLCFIKSYQWTIVSKPKCQWVFCPKIKVNINWFC